MPRELSLELKGTYLPNATYLLFMSTTTPASQPHQWMFPIDPRIANPRVVTSTGMSTHRDAFRHDVEVRDLSCVVTGAPAVLCDAAHILPHERGDQVHMNETSGTTLSSLTT